MANNDQSNYILRYNEISEAIEIGVGNNWLPVSLTTINDHILGTLTVDGAIVEATTSSQAGSFQGIAGDTTLTSGAGRDKGDGGSFQAAIMGNLHGSNLTKTGNYNAGVIGAYDIQGTNASELPKAGLLGMIFDGSTTADGIVVAEIDGSDPSSVTRAGAAFKARQLNANAGSGVDYGLDLFDTAVSGYLSVPTLPLAIANADIRMTHEVCILNGSGAPTNGVTGATFAEIGSLYSNRTSGAIYTNTGTKASPVWTATGTAVAAGADTQIQFNNSNSFGASAKLNWDNSNTILNLSNDTSGGTFAITNSAGAVQYATYGGSSTDGAVIGTANGTWTFTPEGLLNLNALSTTDRDLTTPTEGSLIFNSTTKKLNFYNGTGWEVVTSA